ncbi:MAG: penicillin-binding transpeptidase domain-containing protein [Faecalimonas sp.]|nr:penicillin-binding transpeptidase domain-containing protein [Faecalimonas sp.]
MFNRIKESLGEVFKSRLLVLLLVFGALFFVIIQRLFTLQIVDGAYYQENYTLKIRKSIEEQGTRGTIYDRDGEVLATNRLAYSVQIEDNGSYEDTEQKNRLINETICRVIEIVESHGDAVLSDFGIVLENGEYRFLYAEGTRRQRFLADIYGYTTIDKLSKKEAASTPDDVMDFMCADERRTSEGVSNGFGIKQEDYTKEQVLKLVSVRYGMHLNSYKQYIPTTISSDVSDETVAEIMENQDSLQGISIGQESLREYPDSKYFASILGYTGKISQEEYDDLSDEDRERYAITDIVGKAGIEQLMDTYLQGEKGEEIVYVNNVGKVIESKVIKESKAGNDVYLTIDKDLQITAYKLIEEKLAGIILRKMNPVLDYTRDPNAKDIIIPIGDIYYAFIGNEILDTEQFAKEDASNTERAVYSAYSARQETAINRILADLRNPSAPAYKKLSKEMQAYMYYISSQLLTSKTHILISEKIDVEDPVYQAWQDETIPLYEYLNHAISQNWVDTSAIQAYVKGEDKYSDSSEIYNGILAYIEDYLKTDADFEKLVYRYMIKDGSISGTQICILLYDQEILAQDTNWYNRLLSGYSPYEFIRNKIQTLEITPGQLGVEPSTGSFVMTETGTGRTLVCASYPGYDNNRLANTMDTSYYSHLYASSAKPLYNKATQELTAPGSTFKMVSSAAGIEENVISSGTVIRCSGPYTNVTPSPKCWIFPGAHGGLNVVQAIGHSCNSFYYDVGFRLGLLPDGKYSSVLGTDRIAKYAKMFGLGETSGLEIPEREPQISDEDAVRSAIGQGSHIYSVSQLAKYVTGVANKGTVYDLSLLYKVVDIEGKVIKEYEPKVYKQISEEEIGQSTFNLLHQGMNFMVERDARFNSVRSGGVQMAGKTGTAQQSETHADHVLFVGFAPSNTPEIAMSCRIANGYSSGYPAEIGRDMVLKYYGLAEDSQLVTGSAASLGTETHGD